LGSGREKEMMVDVLKKLTEYVNAIMGGIFVLNDYNKENIFLDQTASVAYQNSKYIKKRVYPGDGLVGQCYLEKEKIYMTNLPDKYIEVHTGLGQANPKNLLLVPLIMDNNVLGVLELASMEIIEDYKIDFIERLSQSLAIAIASYRISLEENQRNEELKMKEAANAANPNFIEDV